MITVVGLGKIGLPLAVQIALKGNQVFGYDINERLVDEINVGINPYLNEEGLSEKLLKVIKSGKLLAIQDLSDYVTNSRAIVVVVPLHLEDTNDPDFSALDSATDALGHLLRSNMLLSYETTVPVGTLRRRIAPILERNSGLRAGIDFNLVHSPERVLTGRVFSDLRNYPKLVGGFSPECTKKGVQFYESILDFNPREDLSKPNGVWAMGSCESTEFTKLAETTYRDVNIALANQFALFARSEGINFQEVIEAANSQPFSHLHKPGISVGGHCIPVYPRLYLWGDRSASIVREGRRVNEGMPEKYVEILAEVHGALSGQRILVLGLAYRGEVKEAANSGAFILRDTLEDLGARVVIQDPLYTDSEIMNLGFKPYTEGSNIDVIVVQADHKCYRDLNSKDFLGVKTVIDGRGILDSKKWSGTNLIALDGPSQVLDSD